VNPARRYGSIQVETASRERLMVLLFEAALKHMRSAGTALAEGRRSEGVKSATRASDIVIELRATLDRAHAPALCDSLGSLYQFVCQRLVLAATSGSAQAAREAERVFAPIADAFTRAVEATK
jgi:flagellar secretion chaperone FliS